ncbi:MAG: SpoIID/LytB domain-containing protein [Flavobacteriia bacterium]|nr:SpoIID/LytB domain-containing protein [Flavobacteriia bacterium]
MRVGVYRGYKINRIVFAYNDGSYSIIGDSTDFGSIIQNEFVDISLDTNGYIKLKKGAVELGSFKKVFIIQNYPNTSIILSPKNPVIKERKYKDDFEVFASKTALTIVNLVDMNNYLDGVVESEGGGGKELDYYKVQALMSRTYALKYQSKHLKEGFGLCDQVHCQAYHNMLKINQLIDSAVRQTNGIIMTDEKGVLIDAYFHANCGGQTSEPELVWNESVPYLYTFKDTFCIYTKQALWEKRIPQSDWRTYLVDQFNYPINDSIFGALIFTFSQPQRLAFYQNPILGIPLRDLREKFDLKSTYFSCYPDSADVVVRGRGYGHGVGLCQEGAMKMAKYGYNFLQIAQYYFPNAIIRNQFEDSFFRQKVKGIEF